MSVQLEGVPSTAVSDLHYLMGRTFDHAERARIDTLIAAVQSYEERVGIVLGSSYTIGFMTVLERERQRQRSAS